MTGNHQVSFATKSRDKHDNRVSRGLVVALVSITAVVGFVAGTRSSEIVGVLAPIFGFKIVTDEIDLSSVQETYQNLKANFDGKIDDNALIDGANRGLVEAAGDDYTVYMTSKEAEEFKNDLSGNIGGGIGAEIGLKNEKVSIIRVLADNPAQKAGLNAGDQILAVNDQSTEAWTVDKTVSEIRGEPDTTVKLSILRDKTKMDFTVTRKVVNNPSVTSEVKDGIGIITISRFDGEGSETANLARRAAQDFKTKNVKGVVLDLRGNGGGHLTAAEDVASLWLNNKVVLTERENGKVVEEIKSGSNAILEGVPTVVLINSSSASASEIVAGALQDHGAAKLVGEKSFGKGSVQTTLELSRDALLKVTIARWYTPNGVNITKEGIAPDKAVEFTQEDYNASRDPQMDAAKAELNS